MVRTTIVGGGAVIDERKGSAVAGPNGAAEKKADYLKIKRKKIQFMI